MNRRARANSLESTQFPRRIIFVLTTIIFTFLPKSAAARESLERRLLRTIQIGAPQDITLAEIKHIAENPNGKYIDNILARSALLVLQQDNPTLVPYNEVLDSVLNNLVPNSNAARWCRHSCLRSYERPFPSNDLHPRTTQPWPCSPPS